MYQANINKSIKIDMKSPSIDPLDLVNIEVTNKNMHSIAPAENLKKFFLIFSKRVNFGRNTAIAVKNEAAKNEPALFLFTNGPKA